MTDNALFDIFDQEEPSAIVELPEAATVIQQTTSITTQIKYGNNLNLSENITFSYQSRPNRDSIILDK